MRWATAGFFATTMLFLPAVVSAQERWRGNFGPGGGFGSGGGYSGPGGGFSGPGGGFSGRSGFSGRGGFDPTAMLKGMDANQNGRIDPNELSGRSRFFVQRAAERAGLDMNQPMDINKLAAGFQRSRDGDGDGDRDRDRGRDNDRRRDDDDRRSNRGGSNSSSAPGSGSSLPVVASSGVVGFGAPAAANGGGALTAFGGSGPEQRYSQRTVDYVEDMLRRYDKNNDGYVDSQEWKAGRWSTPPEESDTNKDNRLSKEELLVRIAKRYGETGSAAQAGSSAASTQQFSVYGAQSLMRQHDRNNDGKLEREEWQSMPSQHHSADTNNDGTITTEELTAKVASFATGNPVSASGNQADGFGGSSTGIVRRFLSPVERLPSGLPSWFLEKDANQDGQVMMSEFTSAWSDAAAADFARCDLNNDGFITAKECLKAESNQ